MMRLSVGLAGVLAALASVSVTQAADLPARAAPVPMLAAAPTWTGFYLGANVAYHWGRLTESGCVGLCVQNGKVRGAYLAVQGGYDYQFANNIVLGIFADVPVTRLHETYNLAPGVVFKLRTEWAGIVGARIGYAYGNFLPYGFVGYEFARTRVSSTASPIPRTSESYNGIALGAGVEYRITQNISADLRYTFANLPKEPYNFGGGVENYGESSHTVQVGVNYRF